MTPMSSMWWSALGIPGSGGIDSRGIGFLLLLSMKTLGTSTGTLGCIRCLCDTNMLSQEKVQKFRTTPMVVTLGL